MKTVKTIFAAVLLFFGLGALSANTSVEVSKLGSIIEDMQSDEIEYAIKPIDAENIYKRIIVPLTEDKTFMNKVYRYRKDGAKYLAQVFATYAEIDYLVSIREYFINNKPKYESKDIDNGLYEIEKIIMTKTSELKFPVKASDNYDEVYRGILSVLQMNDVENIEEYAEVIMVYFSNLDDVKVDVQNYFKSENINKVISYVSSNIIENGKANDLEYLTGEVNIYDLLRNISIKTAIIQSV